MIKRILLPIVRKAWLPLLGALAGLLVGHTIWSQHEEIVEAKKEIAWQSGKNEELKAEIKSVTTAQIHGPTIREKSRTLTLPDGTIEVEVEKHTSGGTTTIKKDVETKIEYVEKEVIKYVEKEVVRLEKPLPLPPLPRWEHNAMVGVRPLDLGIGNVIVGGQSTYRLPERLPLIGGLKIGAAATVPLDNPVEGAAVFIIVGK